MITRGIIVEVMNQARMLPYARKAWYPDLKLNHNICKEISVHK